MPRRSEDPATPAEQDWKSDQDEDLRDCRNPGSPHLANDSMNDRALEVALSRLREMIRTAGSRCSGGTAHGAVPAGMLDVV